jgi:3-oxoacyl-[acyl-carrier protein] reductase
VIGLTKSLAREFAPAIRINGVAPGPVDTPMVSLEHMSDEMIAREVAIPAGRLGRPEEIAAAVLFLVSPQASFFHGQLLGANGGAWMGS